MPSAKQLAKAESALRKIALAFPEATEDFPWGHSAIKVKGKAFLFLSNGKNPDGAFSLSLKLPLSGKLALSLPFASPTEYGLGKSGWVTSRFHVGDDVPTDMLAEWVDESYRAIAPKRLVAQLEDAETGKMEKKRRTNRKRVSRDAESSERSAELGKPKRSAPKTPRRG
jgi:predicted DNA-binding protein (MmcQ/YjbR family)